MSTSPVRGASVESGWKYRDVFEQALLDWPEQARAPLNHRRERPMTRRGRGVGACQQIEPRVEAREDLRRTENAHLRGRQLDRERQPIEAAADLQDRRLRDAGLWRDAFESSDRPWLERVIELLKPRAKRLGQFVDDGRIFFVEDVEYDPAAVKKFLQPAGMLYHVPSGSKSPSSGCATGFAR